VFQTCLCGRRIRRIQKWTKSPRQFGAKRARSTRRDSLFSVEAQCGIQIFQFSSNGKTLGVLRTHTESDVVLLRDTGASPR
jgi:hypothetical protein